MSQLSLYDFLSFFLPGFIAMEIMRIMVVLMNIAIPYFNDYQMSEAELLLLLSGGALIIGLLLHSLGSFFATFKWYGYIIKPSIYVIVKSSNDIQNVIADLELYCVRATGGLMQQKADDFFDHAYYYLEAENKIGPSKGFQSLYFFCSNMALLAFIFFPVFCIVAICQQADEYADAVGWWMILLLSVLFGIMSIVAARFCRSKMVVRVFRTFHILKKIH